MVAVAVAAAVAAAVASFFQMIKCLCPYSVSSPNCIELFGRILILESDSDNISS